MNVLGIHDGHNASACLFADGEVRIALQEERLRRVKNWSGLPVQAVQWILKESGLAIGEIDSIALNGYHAAYPMTRDELMHEYRHINDLDVTLRRKARRFGSRVAKSVGLRERLREHRTAERVRELVALGFPRDRMVFVEHHTAHAAAAYYGQANFSDDILVLTADGSGDGICATVSIGRKGKLERLHAIPMEHSLGNIYAMVTYLMGMVPLEHEYKLMGLAPYAEPKGVDQVYESLIKLVGFDPAAPLGWTKEAPCPETYCSYEFFRDLFQGKRFDWIAGGLQRFTETILAQWVRNCVRATGIGRVVLGGGIFMNVKANKMIMELPEVTDLFVYPSCGDETNAMGAAYSVFAQKAGFEAIKPLHEVYFGTRHSNDEVESELRAYGFKAPVKFSRLPNIERSVAELLASGEVVARHCGREEFGARALGNRSILANPRDTNCIRVINEAIKSRDFWMPFAASILAERAADYVVNPKNIRSPYMIMTFDTTGRYADIAAGTHPYDHTVRPQVVERSWNPRYHSLISEFEKITGIGAVLNTSFNLHGYPIASSPTDSLEVFDRSGLRNLAIEDWLVQKQ
jgi:carbamoyltransferase